MARRLTLPASVVLDAAGNGTVSVTARHPMTVYHTRLSVRPVPPAAKVVKRPAAVVWVDGYELEDTGSGHKDASDTRYDLDPGDTVECRWTGGDPGAVAQMILRAEF